MAKKKTSKKVEKKTGKKTLNEAAKELVNEVNEKIIEDTEKLDKKEEKQAEVAEKTQEVEKNPISNTVVKKELEALPPSIKVVNRDGNTFIETMGQGWAKLSPAQVNTLMDILKGAE